MANSNDLRYVKTERLIRSSYMELLRDGGRSVTVTALCKAALINKSTIYAHYETIEHLRNAIRQEKVGSMLSDDNPAIMGFFVDVGPCVECIFSVFAANKEELGLLFPNWTDMIEPVEKTLLKKYETQGITEEQKYTLRFCIGGILHLISAKSIPDVQEVVIALSKKCVQ